MSQFEQRIYDIVSKIPRGKVGYKEANFKGRRSSDIIQRCDVIR